MGATKISDPTSDERNFEASFKIQGQMYHKIESLIPTLIYGQNFLQTYFMGKCDGRVTTLFEQQR